MRSKLGWNLVYGLAETVIFTIYIVRGQGVKTGIVPGCPRMNRLRENGSYFSSLKWILSKFLNSVSFWVRSVPTTTHYILELQHRIKQD